MKEKCALCPSISIKGSYFFSFVFFFIFFLSFAYFAGWGRKINESVDRDMAVSGITGSPKFCIIIPIAIQGHLKQTLRFMGADTEHFLSLFLQIISPFPLCTHLWWVCQGRAAQPSLVAVRARFRVPAVSGTLIFISA